MPTDRDELQRREQVALEAIKKSLGTEAGEFSATLFASHHLEQLDSTYWQTHLGVDRPEPSQVLDLLRLVPHWSDEEDGDIDGIDTLDFALPEDVSNYVLCVIFDDDGDVDEILMES